jgi:membrane protein required for colicin V production
MDQFNNLLNWQQTMNLLDILMINIVCICLLIGFFRGVVSEGISIAGIFAGILGASKYYPILATLLMHIFPHKAYMNILSFFLLFSAIATIISITGKLISILCLRINFGIYTNRLLGSLFGLTRGVLVTSILLVVLTAFLHKGTPLIDKSIVSPYVTVVSDRLALFVNKDMKNKYFSNMYDHESSWEHRT